MFETNYNPQKPFVHIQSTKHKDNLKSGQSTCMHKTKVNRKNKTNVSPSSYKNKNDM